MFDAILTLLIVALAAAFVICKILLHVRVRTTLRARLAGDQVPCTPDAKTAGCAGGCPGCGLAKPATRK